MTYVSEYMLNIKMGKTFVRGKEKYSWQKKRNLESWLKNTKKNMIKK